MKNLIIIIAISLMFVSCEKEEPPAEKGTVVIYASNNWWKAYQGTKLLGAVKYSSYPPNCNDTKHLRFIAKPGSYEIMFFCTQYGANYGLEVYKIIKVRKGCSAYKLP